MNLAKVVVKRIERKRVNMVLNLFGESQRQAGKASIGDGEAVAGGELWRQPIILAAVLRPWPSASMEAHEVSTLVNSPENDTAECIQAVSPRVKPQLPLL